MDFYRPIKLFRNIWLFLLVNFIWGTLASLYYNNDAFISLRAFVYGSAFGFAISATYIYGFLLIWYEMDDRYNWITQTGKRIFFGLLYGELYAVISFALLAFLFGFINGGNFSDAVSTILYAWKYPAINFFPSVLIVCAVAFFKNWSQSTRNKEKLKAEMMTYKFEALQKQLNPHFLFNSFNVLSNLVYDDQKLAIRFVDQLGEIYNYVLESKNKNLVPLKEELAFIESYCFLLQTRFEEKLEIEINVDSNEDRLIAPMVLQLLIENAVKHNFITKQSHLKIRIFSDNDYIVVSNTLNPKKSLESSTKMGLKNIQQRYGFFTHKEMKIEKSDSFFNVRIPIIKKGEEQKV